jgi:hypothetical protein
MAGNIAPNGGRITGFCWPGFQTESITADRVVRAEFCSDHQTLGTRPNGCAKNAQDQPRHLSVVFIGEAFQGIRMITSEQCEAHLDECRKLGGAPDISLRRATAIMAICRAWIKLSREVARYHIVLKTKISWRPPNPPAPSQSRVPKLVYDAAATAGVTRSVL